MYKAVISGIAHSLGDSTSIDAASSSVGHSDLCEALRADGFDQFILSDGNIVELMEDSIRRTLERSAVRASDIDAVIFATETLWEGAGQALRVGAPENWAIREMILALMSQLGLTQAYPYGSWLSSCANLGPSLALAKALVENGQHNRVLVVVADKQPRPLGHVMVNGAAVYSDVAASFVVDIRDQGYELDRVILHSAPTLVESQKCSDMASFVLATNRAMRELSRKFRMQTGGGCGKYHAVCTNNYRLDSLAIILDGLGISPAVVQRPSRARLGHGHSADAILNLEEFFAAGPPDSQDDVLLLTTAVYSWGIAVVRKKS